MAGLAQANARKGSELTIGSRSSLAHLDPHRSNETFTVGVLLNVFEGLVRRDENLVLRPGLATAWRRVTPRHWRFELRHGVRFHDGTPFTARDVVYSFERAARQEMGQSIRIPKGARFTAVDRNTVDVRLKSPRLALPADWEAVGIVRRPAKGALDESRNKPAHVGTGPYRIVRHEGGARTRFAINQDWWGWKGEPRRVFEHVSLVPVRNDATRTAAFLAGTFDMITAAPLHDIERINQTPDVRVEMRPDLRTIFLNMDQMRPQAIDGGRAKRNPFLDLRVRRAIDHAIDRKSLNRVIMRGYASEARALVSPYVVDKINSLAVRAYDPERARSLMAKAGYGEGFETTMDCPNDRYVNDAALCQAISVMLARIGIKVHLSTMPKSLYFAKVLSGGDYASAFNLLGWTPGVIDGLSVLDHVAQCRDSSGHGGRFNLGGYCNPEVDKLADLARLETDLAARENLLLRAFEQIQRDAGFIVLHQQTIAWGVSARADVKIRPDNQLRFDLITRTGMPPSHRTATTRTLLQSAPTVR